MFGKHPLEGSTLGGDLDTPSQAPELTGRLELKIAIAEHDSYTSTIQVLPHLSSVNRSMSVHCVAFGVPTALL